jgi:hypothetical protein
VPDFYRGAGPRSYWWKKDATKSGFQPQEPGASPSIARLIEHIGGDTSGSPYISLSRSYGVARGYALVGEGGIATSSVPGYVYVIELADPLPPGFEIIDPVRAVASSLPPPTDEIGYQHDGSQNFLLGVVDVDPTSRRYLTEEVRTPRGSYGTPRSPRLTRQLETLVRALRDAEILAVGNLPRGCVIRRVPEW